MGKPRITVVGSNMVDLITYIERMPKAGETLEAPAFEMGFGGKGANQAVAAALLGAEVAMVSKVGDDLFGPNTRRNLEAYGIDVSRVETAPGRSSGVAPIFVEPAAGNSILIVKGANAELGPDDVDRASELIASSGMVILQLEVPLETVYRAVELCAELGVPAILNPAPAAALDLERLESLFLLTPNETELELLTGMPVSTRAEAAAAGLSLVAKGVKRVLVTLGDKGSLYLDEGGELFAPALELRSVDTTGAGDAFIGCLAVRWLETGDMARAMRDANAYAALSTTRRGTQRSFADRAAFEAFLASAEV